MSEEFHRAVNDGDGDIASYGWYCALCDLAENWDHPQARDQASLWHVYVVHPNRWELIYPALDAGPLPETLGRRV